MFVSDSSIIEQDSSEVNTEFDFKYISRNDFNSIYKSVQRRRNNELEKKKWNLFLKKKVEEEKKKECGNSITRKCTDSSVQCSECYWRTALHFNEEIAENYNMVPLISDRNEQRPLEPESSQNEFSLQLPPAQNEIVDSNLLTSNEIPDNWKIYFPKNLSPLRQEDGIKRFESCDFPVIDHDSDYSDGNNLDEISLEYDMKKVQALRSKMILSLRNIYKLIIQGPDYFEKEDIDRVRIRSIEFSNRFKRNYLYRVQCNVNEIEKLLNDKQKVTSKETLAQKIISAHQSCLQTLQIIEKHLPKITVDSPFNLFNDFFLNLCELTKKFHFIFGVSSKETSDDVVSLCETIMDTMIDLIKVKPHQKINNVKPKQKKNVNDSLWMYSNKNSWLSKATALAKSKFGTKTGKSPLNRNVSGVSNKLIPTHYTSKMVAMKQKSKLNIRKRDAIIEDEIKTMVELTDINETDNSEVNEDLQIDANPTLYENESSDTVSTYNDSAFNLSQLYFKSLL